jgi:hypothetical protein
MVRTKAKYSCRLKEIIQLARELRVKLHEIDQKLEHLIRSQHHFYSLHYKERELDD